MDNNINKNEGKIADEIKIKKKKKIKKNKFGKGSNNTDNSQSHIGDKVRIKNVENLTINQINKKLGIAQNSFTINFKNELMKLKEEIIDEVLEQINPLFMLTHLNKGFNKEQVFMWVDNTEEESIRKQAIQKINLLTRKDLEILKLIDIVDVLAIEIQSLYITKIDINDAIEKMKKKYCLWEKLFIYLRINMIQLN